MEFSNPNYKPKVNISIDPREEKYRPFNYKKKSLTPNIRPKSRNRRDLIKEYNESVGYDFQDDSNTESPYTSKWKKNVVPNYTPYSKAHGSQNRVDLDNSNPEVNKFRTVRSKDINLSGKRSSNSQIDDIVLQQKERITTTRRNRGNQNESVEVSDFDRERTSSIFSRKATEPSSYKAYREKESFYPSQRTSNRKKKYRKLRNRNIDGEELYTKNKSFTGMYMGSGPKFGNRSDSIDSNWKKQSQTQKRSSKTTAQLIKELTADIGSTYASLQKSSQKAKEYDERSLSSTMLPQTDKKSKRRTAKKKLLNTAPQKPMNNFLQSPPQTSNFDEKPTYFTRSRPISPPGSSYNALNNSRNEGLSRTYSNSSLLNLNRQIGFLERISNQNYSCRSDRGFSVYQRECKEDLILGQQAGNFLNKMSVQNGGIRFHRDYDSKTLLKINLHRAENFNFGSR